MHLKHLNEHYAHQVSKEIMDFCKENQTGILVLPEYDEDFSRISMYRSGNYSPLHLSIRIRNYLKYKAWAEGILVLELRADGTEKQCSICGATGKKTRQCIHLSEWPSGQPFPERRPKPGPQMPGQLPEKQQIKLISGRNASYI